MTSGDWQRAVLFAAAVLGLHVAGFFLLFIVAAEHHAVLGVGVGITAYTLGVRHAFDADHIAAIDNVTRKLMADGQRPLGVGFFFSLGHSTVVFVLGVLVAVGVRGLGGAVSDETSTLQEATGVIGPVVSGAFLLLIGLLNLAVLIGLVRLIRRADDGEIDAALERRGLLNRMLGRASRSVRRSWQMYPLGCLFGLGFDTATEVALLVLAGAGAASGLPFYAILCLPILFAAGMSLFDTLDGAFMRFAYGWAFASPVRKLFYNLAVTGLSVVVALLIGGLELFEVLFDVSTGIDLNVLGYVVVGLFAATWAVAAAVWRFGRIEERWS